MSDFTKVPMSGPGTPVATGEGFELTDRQVARMRLDKKRRLRGDIAAYLAINAFLVVIWAFTGLGYFWPAWVMAGWGVFLALAIWDVYFRRPISDADVAAEVQRLR
ncbi:MAG: 2TM domain-containing protein [Kineosporiaceae bacterium]